MSFFNKGIFLLFLVGFTSACNLFSSVGGRDVGNAMGQLEKGDLIQKVTVAGVVGPNRKTIITAPYSGHIKKLFVKIGDEVKAGDPLVSVTQTLQTQDPVYPLRAPFAGTVVQIAKSEGEYVKEGDSKEFILRVDDLSKLFVSANVPEIDRIKISQNQEVQIKAVATPDKIFRGIIRQVFLAAKGEDDRWGRAQVEFPIQVEILDQALELKPGMTVILDVVVNKKDQINRLRHEFVEYENGAYFVKLKSGEKKQIQVGLQNEEYFEVLSGLNIEDQVLRADFSSMQ